MTHKPRTALVTGASSGIGRSIAEQFARDGVNLIISARNQAQLEALAAQWRSQYRIQVTPIAADLAQPGAAQALYEAIESRGLALHYLVNNAGHGSFGLSAESPLDYELAMMRVNMEALTVLSKRLLPALIARRGKILNVASTAAVSPRPRLSWYNASKGWMVTATKSMAIELAPLGVRVNAINPVAGETPLLKTFMGEDTPEMRAKFLATIPLGRFSTPEDMGNAACFLCSDEASMITGVAMEVDGGRVI